MKTILNTFFFLLIASVTFGQTVANNDNAYTSTAQVSLISKTYSKAKQERIAKRQNASVAKQLHDHLITVLQYSEVMKENYMEGEMFLQVEISEKGVIHKTKVINCNRPEVTQVLLKAMTGLETLEIHEDIYFGHQKLRIPVTFSFK